MDIYAGVAASLAERKKGSQLTEFFRNIKGTIDDDDWDQVLWLHSLSVVYMTSDTTSKSWIDVFNCIFSPSKIYKENKL